MIKTKIKILLISDTHGRYDYYSPQYIDYPKDIDLVLHAGDITNLGHKQEAFMYRSRLFMEQLSSIAPVYYIPGNHDIGFNGSEYTGLPKVHNIYDKTVILDNG